MWKLQRVIGTCRGSQDSLGKWGKVRDAQANMYLENVVRLGESKPLATARDFYRLSELPLPQSLNFQRKSSVKIFWRLFLLNNRCRLKQLLSNSAAVSENCQLCKKLSLFHFWVFKFIVFWRASGNLMSKAFKNKQLY